MVQSSLPLWTISHKILQTSTLRGETNQGIITFDHYHKSVEVFDNIKLR